MAGVAAAVSAGAAGSEAARSHSRSATGLLGERGELSADVPQFLEEHECHERPAERDRDVEGEQSPERRAEENRDDGAESTASRTRPCGRPHRVRTTR